MQVLRKAKNENSLYNFHIMVIQVKLPKTDTLM